MAKATSVKTKPVSVRIPVADLDAIEKEAQARQTSVGAIIVERVRGVAPSPPPEPIDPTIRSIKIGAV